MFRKLLKHDMRSVFKVWWIAAVITLGAAVVGGTSLYLISNPNFIGYNAISTIVSLGLMALWGVSIMVIASSVMITEGLVFWRFYKNFFTDEGYLTFTLPVSRKKLFLSKTVNAMIWTLLQLVVLFLSLFIMFVISSGGLGTSLALEHLLKPIFGQISSIWIAVYIIEFAIILFFSLLFTISLIHMCITIGAVIAKKLKLLAAIGIYYAINMALSIFVQVGGLLLLSVLGNGLSLILENAPIETTYIVVSLLLLICAAISAALAFLVYCITQRLLDRKLNLA